MDLTVPTVSSRRLCEILGISYRQLDYACRTNPVLQAKNTGSGNRRRFTEAEARRLYVAKMLTEAAPTVGTTTVWPIAAREVMAGPEPLPCGFAVLSPEGWLSYRTELAATDFPTGAVGVVVRYDMTEPVRDDQGFPVFAAA